MRMNGNFIEYLNNLERPTEIKYLEHALDPNSLNPQPGQNVPNFIMVFGGPDV